MYDRNSQITHERSLRNSPDMFKVEAKPWNMSKPEANLRSSMPTKGIKNKARSRSKQQELLGSPGRDSYRMGRQSQVHHSRERHFQAQFKPKSFRKEFSPASDAGQYNEQEFDEGPMFMREARAVRAPN